MNTYLRLPGILLAAFFTLASCAELKPGGKIAVTQQPQPPSQPPPTPVPAVTKALARSVQRGAPLTAPDGYWSLQLPCDQATATITNRNVLQKAFDYIYKDDYSIVVSVSSAYAAVESPELPLLAGTVSRGSPDIKAVTGGCKLTPYYRTDATDVLMKIHLRSARKVESHVVQLAGTVVVGLNKLYSGPYLPLTTLLGDQLVKEAQVADVTIGKILGDEETSNEGGQHFYFQQSSAIEFVLETPDAPSAAITRAEVQTRDTLLTEDGRFDSLENKARTRKNLNNFFLDVAMRFGDAALPQPASPIKLSTPDEFDAFCLDYFQQLRKQGFSDRDSALLVGARLSASQYFSNLNLRQASDVCVTALRDRLDAHPGLQATLLQYDEVPSAKGITNQNEDLYSRALRGINPAASVRAWSTDDAGVLVLNDSSSSSISTLFNVLPGKPQGFDPETLQAAFVRAGPDLKYVSEVNCMPRTGLAANLVVNRCFLVQETSGPRKIAIALSLDKQRNDRSARITQVRFFDRDD